MVNTKVTLCGIEMDNPIIPASGTFGFGYEFAELYDINVLGTFSFKGTTREPRFGNPTPRIAEYAGGLLNAVGLQNPGVDAVIETELPKLKQVFHKPVMANVSGFSVAEYAEVCEKLDAQEQVGWLEVNISCPNVHGGGAAFGADPKSAAEVTKAVRAVTKKPIILKLSPTAADIAAVALIPAHAVHIGGHLLHLTDEGRLKNIIHDNFLLSFGEDVLLIRTHFFIPSKAYGHVLAHAEFIPNGLPRHGLELFQIRQARRVVALALKRLQACVRLEQRVQPAPEPLFHACHAFPPVVPRHASARAISSRASAS